MFWRNERGHDGRREKGGEAVVCAWLLSRHVTLAVWLGATACQVGFKDSDAVLTSPWLRGV